MLTAKNSAVIHGVHTSPKLYQTLTFNWTRKHTKNQCTACSYPPVCGLLYFAPNADSK